MPTPSKQLSACLALLLGLWGTALGLLQGYRPALPKVTPAPPSIAVVKGAAPIVKMFSLTDSQATRRLLPSEVHRYTFPLKSGDFLEVAVDQDPVRGAEIDLTCRIFAPSGAFWYDIDNPTDERGSEYIRIVGKEPGAYQVEVVGAGQTGIYRIRRIVLRRANRNDRVNARAEWFFYIAQALGQRKAYDQALTAYWTAKDLWHSIGNREGEASTLDRAARLLAKSGLGEWDKIESWWSQALSIRLSIQNPKGAAQSLVGLGQSQRNLGKLEQAEQSLREAIRIGRQLGDPEVEADALGVLAATIEERGDPVSAYDLYVRALVLWEKAGRLRQQFTTLASMGQINLSMGYTALAERLYRQAEKLIDQLADDGARAQALSRLCELYTVLGQYDRALVYGRQAVELRRKVGDLRGEAVSLTGLAEAYDRKNDLIGARKAQQDALVIYRRINDKRGEAVAHYHLGLIFLEEKSSSQAIERFEEALTKARELGYKEGQILALYGLALAEQARGNLHESRRWTEKVLPLIESVPQRMGNEENAVAIPQQGSYELLIDLLVSNPPSYTSMTDRASSFIASERARWRSLREWLVAAQGGSSQTMRRDPQLKQMKEAVPENDEVDLRSKEGSKSDKTGTRTALIEGIRMREATIRRKAEWTARPASSIITLPQAQALLDSETILLEYFLGTGRSYVWMVTPNAVEVFALPDRNLIEEKCREFYGFLAASRSRSREQRAVAVSQELSRILLGPLAGRLGNKRLVIVRDGAINYVPFAALADPSPAALPWMGGVAPLVFGHEIVYLPSASVLLALRKETQNRLPATGLMAVMADPEFDREMYEPLPYSRLEGQRLSQLAAGKGRVFSAYGFEATRDLVLSGQLSDFRYLVFVTHGINDPLHPELSALVLAQKGPDGQLLKGHLRVQDIKALDLRSDLAFLSGCRTSLGSKLAGEGFLGLSQSFMYAGVPRVIASLWSVREEATPAFSEHVFRSILLDDATPAEALREAQLWMARESEWHSPYYWAGFEIQGDWR